jgi:hypothetical protein
MTGILKKGLSPRAVTLIGWIENIDFPTLDLKSIKAKIDTGARTTALHATDILHFQREGNAWVAFKTVGPEGMGEVEVEARVHSDRWIKNTSGVPEERIVVRTEICFGDLRWPIDVSLADRSNMTFPVIVGRAALKNHSIAVHTKRAYLVSTNPKKHM